MKILTTKMDGRSVISSSCEDAIRLISAKHGGDFLNINDAHSKTRALQFLRRGRYETVYFLRHTSLSKGKLQVIIRPKIGVDVDKLVLNLEGVEAHTNRNFPKNPRHVFNSNFSAFKNKGDEPTRGEHFGWVYLLDISNSFDPLDEFIEGFVR